jgi:hypothetical protein
MHGSMGGGRKPAPVGKSARNQAPLAYPTNLTSQAIRKHLRDRGVCAGVAPKFIAKRNFEFVGIRG